MSEADAYPERRRQLAAVRFYLRNAIARCSNSWNTRGHGVTNYKTLLDQIRHHNKDGERVCFVTFNCDTLFEDALRGIGVRLEEMADYVADPAFMLIKIHGSIDWWREIRERPAHFPMSGEDDMLIDALVSNAHRIKLSERYVRDAKPRLARNDGGPLFPAIAIPLERKRDFEVPRAHIQALIEFLPHVRQILVIGWRASDAPFLELLHEHLRHKVDALVVAGSGPDARDVVDRLNRLEMNAPDFFDTGFTLFVVNRLGEQFLSR